MNPTQQAHIGVPDPTHNLPWYKQFWPWFIIALPTSAVIACFFTLWLAVSNPVQMVVTDDEYQRLKGELKAQEPVQESAETDSDVPDSKPN